MGIILRALTTAGRTRRAAPRSGLRTVNEHIGKWVKSDEEAYAEDNAAYEKNEAEGKPGRILQ